MNDRPKRIKTCLQRYDTNGYTRLQFLQAVSHRISSYTDDMCDVADDNSSDDDAASDVLIVHFQKQNLLFDMIWLISCFMCYYVPAPIGRRH